MKFLQFRNQGYAEHMQGDGIEIGAFSHPAPLPEGCRVKYVDRFQPGEAKAGFPTMDTSGLKPIDYVLDLNTERLDCFADNSLDFVIINHVIEHVANPVKVVEEVFRVVKPGGKVVIAAPDKRHTFDRKRPLTTWEHLLDDYQKNVTAVSDEHYIDFLAHVHPEELQRGVDYLVKRLESCHLRAEHAHVWDSPHFRTFMHDCFDLLKIKASAVYEVQADQNEFEYFGIFSKN